MWALSLRGGCIRSYLVWYLTIYLRDAILYAGRDVLGH